MNPCALNYLDKKITLRNYRNAINIIQTNVYTRNETKNYHRAKTWIISNPIDDNYFKLYNKSICDIGHILLIGGVRKRKDIITAIKSIYNILGDGISCNLTIVGPIEYDYYYDVINLINSLKISEYMSIIMKARIGSIVFTSTNT